MSFAITSCRDCAYACFPQRMVCPRCGGGDWAAVPATEGVVMEATTVRHRVDAATDAPVHIASVRTDFGVVVVARLDVAAIPGARVRLHRLPSGAVLGDVSAG